MKRFTKKQRQEVEYYEKQFGFKAVDGEVVEFIDYTVNGVGAVGQDSGNRLFQAKRRLEIAFAMWREDLGKTCFKWELLDDARKDGVYNPFFERLMNQLSEVKHG